MALEILRPVEFPEFGFVGELPSIAIAATVVAGSITIMLLTYFINERLRRRLREQEALAESLAHKERLTNVLFTRDWILTFNPKQAKGSEKIEFRPDGTIGEGQNQNESRWELDGEELVIWRENGEIQNGFRYESEADRFVSTDEPAADAIKRGIKGQFIASNGESRVD